MAFKGSSGGGTPPRPKSPPENLDLCGLHRLQVAVQALDREIDLLQDELQSLEGVGPASRYCKEVAEFVSTKPDPFIKINEKTSDSSCHIWKRFRSHKQFYSRTKLCCNISWPCCSSGCSLRIKRPKCCFGKFKGVCCRCHMRCLKCNCCKISCCSFDPSLSSPCPEYSCGCVCSCSRCTEVCVCRGCTRACCIRRCIC